MYPKVWGKCIWNSINYITMDYPENPTDEDKQHYYQFFQSLQYVLPCARCRFNLQQNLQKYPLTLEALTNRDTLLKWVIDLHNIVNYHTGKKVLPYYQALQKINRSMQPDNRRYYYLVIFLVVIIILILVYFIYRKIKKN